MDAGNRATRGAGFFGEKFAMALLVCVFRDGDAGIAALLGAIVDQTVFADVEVTRAGPAAPVVLKAGGDIVLELVDPREGALSEGHDFFEDFLLARAKRLELSVAVVEDAYRGCKTELDGAAGDSERVFGITDAAAEHGVDVDVKLGVLGEKLKFLVENFQAFFGDVVRLDVINADLEVLEAGAVESLDAVCDEKVTVGYQTRHDSVVADAGDDFVELGVEERLAAADGDDGGAHGTQAVNAAKHFVERDRVREIVEFVAIRAREIAAANRNDVREKRVARGGEPLREHAELAELAMRRAYFPANFLCGCH